MNHKIAMVFCAASFHMMNTACAPQATVESSTSSVGFLASDLALIDSQKVLSDYTSQGGVKVPEQAILSSYLDESGTAQGVTNGAYPNVDCTKITYLGEKEKSTALFFNTAGFKNLNNTEPVIQLTRMGYFAELKNAQKKVTDTLIGKTIGVVLCQKMAQAGGQIYNYSFALKPNANPTVDGNSLKFTTEKYSGGGGYLSKVSVVVDIDKYSVTVGQGEAKRTLDIYGLGAVRIDSENKDINNFNYERSKEAVTAIETNLQKFIEKNPGAGVAASDPQANCQPSTPKSFTIELTATKGAGSNEALEKVLNTCGLKITVMRDGKNEFEVIAPRTSGSASKTVFTAPAHQFSFPGKYTLDFAADDQNIASSGGCNGNTGTLALAASNPNGEQPVAFTTGFSNTTNSAPIDLSTATFSTSTLSFPGVGTQSAKVEFEIENTGNTSQCNLAVKGTPKSNVTGLSVTVK